MNNIGFTEINQNYPPSVKTKILLGDCVKFLKNIDDNSVNLVFTSLPYADRRKKVYGGIHPDKYAEWFLSISLELLKVLKPTGTFVLITPLGKNF